MTHEEAQRIAQITERMTTRCVGRYLIDLPEKFVLNSQSVTEIEGVRIKVRPVPRIEFASSFETRSIELRRSHMDGRPDRPVLKELKPSPQFPIGGIFDRAESTGTSEVARTLELLTWSDGFSMSLSTEATNGTNVPFDESTVGTPYETSTRRIYDEYKSVNTVPEKLTHLLNVYRRLRGRAETDIPTERGFCFPGGFMQGDPSEDEQTYVPFHLNGSPDLYFHVSANEEASKEQTSLLQRGNKVEAEMVASGTKTIRKGVVRYAGQDLEEWLMRGPTPDRVPGTMFGLVANEATRGVDRPFMRVDLFNGFRIPARQRTAEESAQLKDLTRATLSEAEAVALWDKVTQTFRQRPGAF